METPALESSPSKPDSLGRGLLLTLLLHAVGLPLIAVVAALFQQHQSYSAFEEAFMITGLNFGWAQVLYVIPAVIVLHVKGLRQTRNGLLLLAGIGFLITSGCWGLIAFSF